MNAPDWLFDEVEDAVAELVKELARTYGTDREGEIAELWEKGWNAVRRRAPAQIVALDEPLTDALNDAAGKLADAALARLSKYRPRVGNRLPEPVRGYFNAITEEPSGHLGQVMIATRLHYLYAVDQDWVSERCQRRREDVPARRRKNDGVDASSRRHLHVPRWCCSSTP